VRRVARGRSIVYVVGARPNFIKTAPVVHQMRIRAPYLRHVVVHTGQHYDHEMSEIFFDELGLPAPNHLLGVGSGAHGAQTGRALERIEDVLLQERPELIVVPGDVNSTLAGALAAVKLRIPVAHLEAGLRSFDRTMPEEINRLLVDQLSRWCFIHSREAETNLAHEGIARNRIAFVGNTMIDTLVRLRARMGSSSVHADLGLVHGDYLLVTLHRPALVDTPLFPVVLERLAELGRDLPVVFPMHPRTQARLPEGIVGAPGLRLVEPVGYVDFLALQAHAAGVLTDSGGVQEETTYLRIPCFTLRENTERPVTLTHGTNRLLGLGSEALAGIPSALARAPVNLRPPEGWDGRAGERVADVLLTALGQDAAGSQYSTLAAARPINAR